MCVYNCKCMFVCIPVQNPPDCAKAHKLVCNINKGCGYGCQLHHVVYCFMIAYGTERTLVLESHNWRYAPNGWETVFRPLSNTCTECTGASTGHWTGERRAWLKGNIIHSYSNLYIHSFPLNTWTRLWSKAN